MQHIEKHYYRTRHIRGGTDCGTCDGGGCCDFDDNCKVRFWEIIRLDEESVFPYLHSVDIKPEFHYYMYPRDLEYDWIDELIEAYPDWIFDDRFKWDNNDEFRRILYCISPDKGEMNLFYYSDK